MALDGIAIASIVHELQEKLVGGRIDKIYQPENDEIVMAVRSKGNNYKLLITASPSNPRTHLTLSVKENPMQPPVFCMVLRKYLTGGKITAFSQPNFERIIFIKVESLNELGDLTEKTIVIEIMGKHSNIILLDDSDKILDSVKRISHDKSSVREVLPGKLYSLPPSRGKKDPNYASETDFSLGSGTKIQKWIYETYSGISPLTASELCQRSGILPSLDISELSDRDKNVLFISICDLMNDVKNNKFCYNVIYDEKKVFVDFAPLEMTLFFNSDKKYFDSPSEMLEFFYSERDARYHILQKSQDLRKLISTGIERLVKKHDIQQKTLSDIENREIWKLYGELITSNIYAIKKGMDSFTTINFYDEAMPEITITLDKQLSPSENAQKYFKRYNKEKRTFEALISQIEQTTEELQYLEGVLNAVLASTEEADLDEIRLELATQGFVKKKRIKNASEKQKRQKKTKPMSFVSSDGFEIFVGKSNAQNDELTLRFATPDDIWLHTKNIPGSHVIIKTVGKNPPDKTVEQAACLAAYFSKARDSSLVPVDYTTRKNVKKPNGSRPGMVIYDNYKTAYVTPSEPRDVVLE